MSESTHARIPTAPPRQPLPLLQMILVGLQHVLLMYGGAVAVPLIIGQAAGLSREEIAFLINADLLVAGIATVVQSLGIGPLGIRMPIMMGASFAAVGSMVAMAGMPGVGLTGIFGATITAGFFGMLIAPFMSKIVRFFPPLVTGTVITSIGLSLFPVAVNWAGGGSKAVSFGEPIYLAVAALVLATILLINRFMRGFWVNISVLIGMGMGYVLSGLIGMVDLTGLAQAPWVRVVTPLHFGMPEFHLAPILSMCLVVVIIFVESTGMFLALGKITDREVTPGMLRRGLMCDAAASFLAGFLNTFTHSSFAQNIGLVQMTGVRCRYVTVVAGGFLISLSLLPKAAFLVASIPPAVLGGAAIAMFGMVAATGIKILQEADIGDRRNQLLVAVSIGMGLIPVVRPEFFAHLPLWMGPITHSGIALATLSAVLLNLLFNVLGGAEREAMNKAAHPH
ncbi:nucleobase:cation symporter-2 family protein [Pseudomonas sp. CCI3.2]|uniref:nucleobase:cation symporter-2 family protein n=1 Tax=unclassified Pseudomonas TaxID=196821 RepID=UPI002AC92249|nr:MULTISPECIES: nucleobase:cation symporter-2 family protein [unclassified Pseudomonas]MEB0078758.1 nucleobase:cation symporter-2 family protein [Pseudomonas sp. MH10out]MEB0100426.1 nucleobase:cation symporter-2 family protein [Pseudomonas sp. CCI3.2]MEB0129550.1 nucleobase:cation symporter-2 family protein [Pseudomonas sp. CCI2.4]MEB0157370.1 nucleobase:cation symporter-2 family protein [Pseudomonas sp. AH2 (2023)]MEB0166588.1 nucleobase:cation symporter-2 family protein [Pseudomonas sp. CC